MRSVQEILAELQAPPHSLTLVQLRDSLDSLQQWESDARQLFRGMDGVYVRWFLLQAGSMHLLSSGIRKFDRMETLEEMEARYPPLGELVQTVWDMNAPFSQFFQLCESFKCSSHLNVDAPTYCMSSASLAVFHDDQSSYQNQLAVVLASLILDLNRPYKPILKSSRRV